MGQRPNWYGKKKSNPGLRYGFRSGLEKANSDHLKKHGEPVLYEVRKVKYVVPAKGHTYTVDFELRNGILVETKGLFSPEDRAKHLLVHLQYPDLELRFVFTRPNAPMYKGATTTYAGWCEKHGFKYAAKLIPVKWMREVGPSEKPSDVLSRPPLFEAVSSGTLKARPTSSGGRGKR